MTSGTRIGILGGTFDPVHSGHIDTAVAAHRALALDTVLVLPSGTPPHRPAQPAASRFHRFAMTALAVNGLPELMVSDLEIGLTEPCYTFDTLARLQKTGLSAAQIFFITGADAFAEIGTWSRYPQVLEMAHFVVVSRPGFPVASLGARLPALAKRMRAVAAPATARVDALTRNPGELEIMLVDAATLDVSSTEVRRRLESGAPITGLVPESVETYIGQHRLYARQEAGARLGNSLA
jgi:nicotinate-nucleotide adenylyltransferase